MAGLEYQFLSSSMVREVARLGGSVSNLVPEAVQSALASGALFAGKISPTLFPERERGPLPYEGRGDKNAPLSGLTIDSHSESLSGLALDSEQAGLR
jgi:hypothetical protein